MITSLALFGTICMCFVCQRRMNVSSVISTNGSAFKHQLICIHSVMFGVWLDLGKKMGMMIISYAVVFLNSSFRERNYIDYTLVTWKLYLYCSLDICVCTCEKERNRKRDRDKEIWHFQWSFERYISKFTSVLNCVF